MRLPRKFVTNTQLFVDEAGGSVIGSGTVSTDFLICDVN